MTVKLISREDFYNFETAIYLFTPMQYCLNRLALTAFNGNYPFLSKSICTVEYFVTPIDRLIQILAIPVFSILTDDKNIYYPSTGIKNKIKIALTISINIIIRIVTYSIAILFNLSINILSGYKLYKVCTKFSDGQADFFKARQYARTEFSKRRALFFQPDEWLVQHHINKQNKSKYRNHQTDTKPKQDNQSSYCSINTSKNYITDAINKLSAYQLYTTLLEESRNKQGLKNDELIAEFMKYLKVATVISYGQIVLTQSAANVFGFENLDHISSKRELSLRRRNLAKIFHPDKKTYLNQSKILARINKVYDLILEKKEW